MVLDPRPGAPAHRALLRAFLEHTDLVKFAEARPTPGQIDETVNLWDAPGHLATRA